VQEQALFSLAFSCNLFLNQRVCMTPDQLIELKSNPVLRGRLAKFFALECFRNSKLEDLHTGKSPSSKTGDYSDIKVVTPYGEIPWNTLFRLNDKITISFCENLQNIGCPS
jgi:hypothetical protein